MNTFEPIGVSDQFQRLWVRVVAAQRGLARGRTPDSPFLADFPGRSVRDEILGLHPEDPLRGGLLAWCDVLFELRVNFEALRLEADCRFAQLHPPLSALGQPAPLIDLERALLRAAMAAGGEKEARGLFDGLVARVGPLSAVRRERCARRLELEARLGERLSEWCAPAPAESVAWRVLRETHEVFEQWAEAGPVGSLRAGMAAGAIEGWPGRLTSESIKELLGGDWLVRGLRLPSVDLPERQSPASFLEATEQLAAAVAFACAPMDLPFVVRRRPGDLEGVVLGHTLTSWMRSPDFVRRRLGLASDKRRFAQRALWLSGVAHLRQLAAQSLCLAAARSSTSALDETYEEVGRLLYRCAPGPALGMLAAPLSAPVELCGALIGIARHRALREEHDEDFIDNPRARDQLRSELGRPAQVEFPASELDAGWDEWLAAMPRD